MNDKWFTQSVAIKIKIKLKKADSQRWTQVGGTEGKRREFTSLQFRGQCATSDGLFRWPVY